MELKNENKKKEEEKDYEYEKRITKLFYSTMYNKIKDNVDKSYKNILNKKSSLEIVVLTLKYLITLRNYIYEERIFSLYEIEHLLHFFPAKYLNVFLYCNEELNENQINFRFYHFFFHIFEFIYKTCN